MKKKLIVILQSIVIVFSIGIGLGACGAEKTGMVIGTDEFVDTLNPLTAKSMMSSEVFNLIYDPLVRYDENLVSVPCLAEYWEISDDQLTWTFHLLKTKWHDGEDFTSADVKYTYELFMTEVGVNSYYGRYLTGIEQIECPDDRTVVITTAEPKANMLQNPTPILPEHIWKAVGEKGMQTYLNEAPIGTGPYLFGEMGEDSLTLLLNKEYFTNPGKVSSYSFIEYKNNDSVVRALKTGEIDAAVTLSGEQLSQLEGEDGIDVISGQIPGIVHLSFNISSESKSTGNPLLKDVRIRQAIEYCIDKNKGIKKAYSNSGTVGTSLINYNDPFHWEPTTCLFRDYDIKIAKQRLDRAGYKDTNKDGIREDRSGNPLHFQLIISADDTEYIKYGKIIKEGCKKAGIDIECTIVEASVLRDKIYTYDYDLVISERGTDVDPSDMLEVFTTDFGNETGWSNAKYDKMFLEQAITLDRFERVTLVQEMQKIVYKDAPYIVLLYKNRVQAIRADRWESYIQIPEGGSYFLNKSIMNYMKIRSK